MKLYYAKGACSLAARIFINELGLDATYEEVNLKTKQTASGKDFYKINPKGSVPFLELEQGETLSEGAVILQYLADENNATQFLPAVNEMDRYHVLEWVNYVSTEVHKSFGLLFSPLLSDEVKEKFVKPLINTKLKYLNQHFSTHTYLALNQYTIGDIYLFVVLRWSSLFKIDLQEWPHINRFYTDIHQRSAIKASLKQEA